MGLFFLHCIPMCTVGPADDLHSCTLPQKDKSFLSQCVSVNHDSDDILLFYNLHGIVYARTVLLCRWLEELLCQETFYLSAPISFHSRNLNWKNQSSFITFIHQIIFTYFFYEVEYIYISISEKSLKPLAKEASTHATWPPLFAMSECYIHQ